MTQTDSVSPKQRYTRGHPCPICDNYASLLQGKGVRCFGYLSSDEKYAFCTREEKSGNLEPHNIMDHDTYMHTLNGPCDCGTQHGAPLPGGAAHGHKPYTKSQPRAHESERRIVAEYSYQDVRGRLLYQSVRYEPKS